MQIRYEHRSLRSLNCHPAGEPRDHGSELNTCQLEFWLSMTSISSINLTDTNLSNERSNNMDGSRWLAGEDPSPEPGSSWVYVVFLAHGGRDSKIMSNSGTLGIKLTHAPSSITVVDPLRWYPTSHRMALVFKKLLSDCQRSREGDCEY